MQDGELPDSGPIIELLNGFRRSKVLFTLVSLGIPEQIAERKQLSLQGVAAAVAKQSHCQPSLDGLARLLDASVSLGLLGGTKEGYWLTRTAETYLVPDSPYSLAGYVVHSDRLLYKLWGGLETSILTGTNCWEDAFGLDGTDVFAR